MTRDKDTLGFALTTLWRRSRRAATITIVIAALLIAGVCWFFGVEPVHAAGIGCVGLAIGLIWVAVPYLDQSGWERRAARGAGGTRRDVAQLAAALTPSLGRVSDTALERVTVVARQRLALHHLDLENPADRPAIESLIGRPAYSTLRPRENSRRLRRQTLTFRRLVHCIEVVDALQPPHQQTALTVKDPSP